MGDGERIFNEKYTNISMPPSLNIKFKMKSINLKQPRGRKLKTRAVLTCKEKSFTNYTKTYLYINVYTQMCTTCVCMCEYRVNCVCLHIFKNLSLK